MRNTTPHSVVAVFLLSLHKKQRPVLRLGRRQANSDVADNETRAHDQGHT